MQGLRLLAPGGERLTDMAVAHRIYADTLYVAQVHEALADFDAAMAASALQPAAEADSKAAILADLAGDEEPLFTHFLQVVAEEKGRAGEARGDRQGVRAAGRARGAASDGRADDGARAHAEATAILKQIEDAAGRKVEATQKVDPDLVGGIVLQAGSLRVDASVRGRLERLRNELVRS